MARRQTRRSISVKGLTYQRLKSFCESQTPPLSLSGFVEELVIKKLDELGAPEETVLIPRPVKTTKNLDNFTGSHFTF